MGEPSGGKAFSWQALVAIGGLVATLIGLWVQYEGKQAELDQAQAKIDAVEREAEQRRLAKQQKRAELDSRMQQIDNRIAAAEMEIRRGTSGFLFAPDNQKAMAASTIESANAEKASLLAERAKLQEKIDALPSE